MQWLYNESKLWWLLFLIVTTIICMWVQQTFFISDSLYYNTYGDQLSIETIEMFISNAKEYLPYTYVAATLVIVIRILFTSICLYIASFFAGIAHNFKCCYNIALKADVVFLMAGLFNLVYHLIVSYDNLIDMAVNPLLLSYYVDLASLPKYLLYPLSLVNGFEIAYWLLLALLWRYAYKYSFADSLAFVAKSYGWGLLFIILVIALIVV